MKVERLSRNAQRKRAYKAQANASSRNETTIDGPIIGHFETVTHETVTTYGEDGEPIKVRTKTLVIPFTKIVHDAATTTTRGKAPKSRGGKGAEGRRMRAQARCAARHHLAFMRAEIALHNERCLHCGATL